LKIEIVAIDVNVRAKADSHGSPGSPFYAIIKSVKRFVFFMFFLCNVLFSLLLVNSPDAREELGYHYYGKGISLGILSGYSVATSAPATKEALRSQILEYYPPSFLKKMDLGKGLVLHSDDPVKKPFLVVEEFPGAADYSRKLSNAYSEHIKERLTKQGWSELEVTQSYDPVIVGGVACVQLQVKGNFKGEELQLLSSLVPNFDSFLEVKMVQQEKSFAFGYKIFKEFLNELSGANAPNHENSISVFFWQLFFIIFLIVLFRISRNLNRNP